MIDEATNRVVIIDFGFATACEKKAENVLWNTLIHVTGNCQKGMVLW
jgi:hypothetical protein